MNDEQLAKAAALGWLPDNSPETEMRNGNWFRHGITYELKDEDSVLQLIEP